MSYCTRVKDSISTRVVQDRELSHMIEYSFPLEFVEVHRGLVRVLCTLTHGPDHSIIFNDGQKKMVHAADEHPDDMAAKWQALVIASLDRNEIMKNPQVRRYYG